MSVIDLVANALGGGVLGAVGAVAEKYIMGNMELRQKKAEWAHIKDMHTLQAQLDAQQAEQGLILAQTEGDLQGLVESVKHDASIKFDSALEIIKTHPKLGGFILTLQTLVNTIRALFRPFLTLYLLDLAVDDDAFIGVASACVFWWIGSRGTAAGSRKIAAS